MTTSTMHDLLARMATDPSLAHAVHCSTAELADRFGPSVGDAALIAGVRVDEARPVPRRDRMDYGTCTGPDHTIKLN